MQQISSISSSKGNFFRSVKRIAAVCATLGLIIAGIYVCKSYISLYESEPEDKRSFFENPIYDVLFLGTSHVMRSISPFQLYNDFGITSYNLGTSSCSIVMSYQKLPLSYNYCSPKIAVLDVYGCRVEFPAGIIRIDAHRCFDIFELSKKKNKAIDNLFQLDFVDLKKELKFPFSMKHNKWKDVDYDFISQWNKGFHYKGKNIAKGFCYSGAFKIERNILPYKDMKWIDSDAYVNFESLNIEYIKKFIIFCQENNIQPVLVYLPPASGILQQKESNFVQKLSDFFQVPYYNMLYNADDIIDINTDFLDCNVGIEDIENDVLENGNIHLNLSGAIKVTDYIGKILRNDFNLADHRGESGYEAWNDDYKTFRKYILGEISKQSELDVLLMSCMFEGLSVQLDVAEGIAFDDVEQRLIAQLGKRISIVPSTRKELECDVHITITDDETHDTVTEKFFNTGYSTFRTK